MYHPNYDSLVQFASEGKFEQELQLAKIEFTSSTGDLFESDFDFESRIASFLEWYTLDRMVSIASNASPAKLYIEHVSPNLTTPEIQALRTLTRTILSVFEIKKMKNEAIRLVDILTNEKYDAQTRSPLAGIQPGDLIEGRLQFDNQEPWLSDIVYLQPRVAKKSILKAAKAYRKNRPAYPRVQMVQRVAFLRNRAVRYSHVDPLKIFEDLSAA